MKFKYRNKVWDTDTLKKRFDDKFDKGKGCWEWRAGINKNSGYGRFYLDKYNPILAHRLSWLIYNGKLKACACHTCDKRKCERPSHLFDGTRADNNRDMTAKGRHGYTGSKGMNHPRRKLTEKEVGAIREAYSSGVVTQAALAKAYGVTQAQVSNIVRWVHWTT